MSEQLALTPELALRLINSGKLSNAQLMDTIGGVFEEKEIWRAIAEKINWKTLGTLSLLVIGKKADDLNIWKQIITTGKLSYEAVFEIGETIKQNSIWEVIIATGWKGITPENLLKIGKTANNIYVWEKIIMTGKLSPEQLFNMATEVDIREIWEAITVQIEQPEVE